MISKQFPQRRFTSILDRIYSVPNVFRLERKTRTDDRQQFIDQFFSASGLAVVTLDDYLVAPAADNYTEGVFDQFKGILDTARQYTALTFIKI